MKEIRFGVKNSLSKTNSLDYRETETGGLINKWKQLSNELLARCSWNSTLEQVHSWTPNQTDLALLIFITQPQDSTEVC